MAATLEAPPAAAASPPVKTAQVGSAAPPSTGEIHVGVAPPIEPLAPPKPGSAMERMQAELRKKVKDAPKPTDNSKPEATTTEAARPDNAKPKGKVDVVGTTDPTDPKTKEKVSPWKLVDEYKAKLASKEKEIADARSASPAEQQTKEWREKTEKLDAENKQLREEQYFANYVRSDEFKTQYQEPYNKAWQSAMSELTDITVNDPISGDQRTVTPQDILELVNMSLPKAREAAREMFGEFADDVMAHRKEIRGLFDKQQQVLEEVRSKGLAREQEKFEKYKQASETMRTQVQEVWTKANDEALKHPEVGKFLSDVEGDEEGNTLLAKGRAQVDEAFNANPLDPRLTPEEREKIIRKHAAVRNKAASWNRLRRWYEKATKEADELREKLKQYEASEPPAGGRLPAAGETTGGSVREQVMAELRKRAK